MLRLSSCGGKAFKFLQILRTFLYYELQNNQPMSEEQRDFAQNLIERIQEEHA